MTQPQHLPASAYRIGMRVRVINPKNVIDDQISTVSGIDCRSGGPEFVWVEFSDRHRAMAASDLRPVLRPVTSLTDEEARAVFIAAFGCDPGEVSCKVYSCGEIEIEGKGIYTLTLSATGDMSGICERDHNDAPYAVTAYAVLDYLDQIGVDGRGWIARGLAVAETETITN